MICALVGTAAIGYPVKRSPTIPLPNVILSESGHEHSEVTATRKILSSLQSRALKSVFIRAIRGKEVYLPVMLTPSINSSTSSSVPPMIVMETAYP